MPLQNGQFGSKIRNTKNMRKTILQDRKRCSVQKIALKNTKYSRKETTLKNRPPCKRFEKGQFRSKIRSAKNFQNTILQEH